MRHQDLGERDGPVLVFGGPYSNLQALQAVLDVAAARGIGAGNLICTGDVVAYCGDPVQVVEAVRASGMTVVAGNCELQLAQGALDCGCGFDDGSACDLLSAGWFGFASAQVTQDQRDWMGQLPQIVTFSHQGKRYGVIHGGVTDVARFIWPSSPKAVFAEEWQAAEDVAGPLDAIIAGHCGVPFIRNTARGRWINAGVIGMPPHDGAQYTRFGVIDGADVLIHSLKYDAQAAVNSMENAGLVQGYHRALMTGYWPSEDVLPDDLRLPPFAKG
ncbi:Calcineurin-like phosphoesterase superfamily domain-containing protein [Sulfitobacter brevis]|uniref:Calcineurin-like phosphoesterase superfamily domain-containing protein n=1 Tax=Sulfitobacter brevis TaxID=74348 RepID=A0A1I1V2K4_9RHOB|nr:metallophosphoesterase family protein [Sulfitobacter brevis]SFD77099.1 Calcineurin-like phosphoesterase superfamily domain-containing protein [Sulfitobacter brevis]